MNLRTFDSLRVYILFSHLISTCFLIWTRYPSIQVTLGPNYSSDQYTYAENSYLGLIAFGIIFLSFQIMILPFHFGKLSFRATFNLACDVAAIFFNLWIALDALGWDTYIYIFVFCVLVPSILDLIFVLPMIYHYVIHLLHEFLDFLLHIGIFILKRIGLYSDSDSE